VIEKQKIQPLFLLSYLPWITRRLYTELSSHQVRSGSTQWSWTEPCQQTSGI